MTPSPKPPHGSKNGSRRHVQRASDSPGRRQNSALSTMGVTSGASATGGSLAKAAFQATGRPQLTTILPTQVPRAEKQVGRHPDGSRMGIDCTESLTWRHWQPGGEFERKVVIKNYSPALQVVRYQLPQQKATFFVDFPQPVTLSSGTTFEILIKFRPTVLEEYHDELLVEVEGKGTFAVRLFARTPFVQLDVPDQFDFGFCPVNDTTTGTMVIRNSGTLSLALEWDVLPPFCVEPSAFKLAEGESRRLHLSFMPTEANAVVSTAVCRRAGVDHALAIVSISGIGKYPFIRAIRSPNVEFGSVPTDQVVKKSVIVANPSLVDAAFAVRRLDRDVVNAFHVSPTCGVIPKGDQIQFTIAYHPETTGADYSTTFEVATQGGNVLLVQCTGTSSGPMVSLSTKVIDFGDVDLDLGSAAFPTKVIVLRNHADRPARYSFNGCSPGNSFSFEPHTGSLGPKSTQNITIRFAPSAPMNMLRRVYVLLQNGAKALYLDVFGTGFSARARPSPFTIRHVVAYRARVANGLARVGVDDLERVLEDHDAGIDPATEDDAAVCEALLDALAAAESATVVCAPQGTALQRARGATYKLETRGIPDILPLTHALPVGDDNEAATGSDGRAYALSPAQLRFREGRGEDDTQIVTVFNHTSSKAQATWAVQPGTLMSNGQRMPARWSVLPESEDVPPMGNATFRVRRISGAAASGSYGDNLECYIAPKSMRSFRLVADRTLTPPECLVLPVQRVVAPGDLSAPPQPAAPSHIAFPAVKKGAVALQVVVISNPNDTSSTFDIQITNQKHLAPRGPHDPQSAFAVRLAGNAGVLPGVKAPPRKMEAVDSPNYAGHSIADPQSPVDRTVSDESFARHTKASRAPAPGDLVVDEEEEAAHQELLNRTFACFPSSGIIPPKGSVQLMVRFTPADVGRFSADAVVCLNEAAIGRRCYLRGDGFVAQLSLPNNAVVAMRPTAIGATTIREYVVQNPSRIPIVYTAVVPPPLQGVVSVTPARGRVEGCAKLPLQISFSPTAVSRYEGHVTIELQAADGSHGVPIMMTSPAPNASMMTASALSGGGVDDLMAMNTSTAEISTGARSEAQKLLIMGEGQIGAVAIEPLEMDFGMLLVGKPVTKTATLYNSSLCNIHAVVRWRCLMAEGISLDPDDASSAAGVIVPPLDIKLVDGGLLRSRTHESVDVTVQLPRRGAYRYVVFAVCHGSKVDAEAADPTYTEIMRMPYCELSADGGYPTLHVGDCRSVFQRKSILWRRMSLTELNDHLILPVDSVDVETKTFDFDGAADLHSPFVCDLGCDTFRTEPIKVLLHLENAGHCPVSFRFWFPDESDVPKETWHHDPVTGLERETLAAVLDRKLFAIEPREATVPPGGSVVVCFIYNHTVVGSHQLPVMLKIGAGRRALLHLRGRTLSPMERHFAFHHSMQEVLAPVAIGELDPPLQYIELQNTSHYSSRYRVDQTALQATSEANYDFPVLQCLNPEGVVPPMSTVLLSIYFRPLEAKEYVFQLPVSIESGSEDESVDVATIGLTDASTYKIQIQGLGYHPSHVTAGDVRCMHSRDLLRMPPLPRLHDESLPMSLSLDALHFGAVPMHSLHRRVVTLCNSHPTDTFLFEWHSVLQYGDQLLDVEPPRGRLLPGQSQPLRLTFFTGSTSHVIEHPVHCHVINESLRLRREERQKQASHLAAMALTPSAPGTAGSSIIGGTSVVANTLGGPPGGWDRRNRLQPGQTAAPGNGVVRARLTSMPSRFQSTRQLRHTIQTLRDDAVAGASDPDDPSRDDEEVLPTVLELLIRTQILTVDRYEEVYGDSAMIRQYFPTFKSFATPVRADEVEAMLAEAPVSSYERSLVADVLESVIRDVVQHRGIGDAYRDVAEDPVPYFFQLAASADETVERPREIAGLANESCTENRDSGPSVLHLVSDAPATAPIDPQSTSASDESNMRQSEMPDQMLIVEADPVDAHPIPEVETGDASITLPDEARQDGELQCLIEEALEDAIFSLVGAVAGNIDSLMTACDNAFPLPDESPEVNGVVPA